MRLLASRLRALGPRLLLGVAPLASPLVAGCSAESPPVPAPAILRDATSSVGLSSGAAPSAPPSYYMPEIMGSGCALLDYDGDADLDLFVVRRGTPPGAPADPRSAMDRLYRNDPGPVFVDVTDEAGVGDPGYGMGVAVGDVDDDGRPDLYVTNVGRNTLYRNLGTGAFADATEAAGVGHTGWGTAAVFFDADGDRRLDLFVANYVRLDPARACTDASGRPEYCGPREFPGAPDAFYRNRGDGTFEDASEESGIGAAARRGLGAVAGDFDGDGRPDLYVANDNHPNQLWIQRPDGTFVDEAFPRGAALNRNGEIEASMGIVAEDLDGDARIDLFVTNLRGESNTLWRAEGNGAFRDATPASGLLAPSVAFTGFGAAAFDAENDGDLDLAIVNGHVFRGPVDPASRPGDPWREYAQPGLFFRNDGEGRFRDESLRAGTFGSETWVGRGLAAGDLDGDGGVDLVATDGAGRVLVFRNEAAGRGSWIAVRALEEGGRRDALGALVTVVAGGRRIVRRADGASSYLSASDPRAHFGLGSAAQVDEIEVRWPGGAVERFPGAPAGRVVTVVRGEGR